MELHEPPSNAHGAQRSCNQFSREPTLHDDSEHDNWRKLNKCCYVGYSRVYSWSRWIDESTPHSRIHAHHLRCRPLCHRNCRTWISTSLQPIPIRNVHATTLQRSRRGLQMRDLQWCLGRHGKEILRIRFRNGICYHFRFHMVRRWYGDHLVIKAPASIRYDLK